MCGICGCVGHTTEEKIYNCIKRISHRGPDALCVRMLKDAVLAHARLSIIDVSVESNQPMSDITGRYWIVFNGEVYNFIELREILLGKGYKFRTSSDTEVVLNAYIEWGESFQNKCNGMWGLAIWDSLEKSLFLSRDRFGVKPLYYYQDAGNFYFASEMKAFFPIMREKSINSSIVLNKNLFSYEAFGETPLKGIKKLRAGYSLKLENNKLIETRWWNTLDNLITVPNDYQKQVLMLRELFEDACRIRMRSDVPIGTALSGGVDSSAVVGMMHRVAESNDRYANKDWQHTYVASMPNTELDETYYASKAAEHVGIDINKVFVTGKGADKNLYKYLYLCEHMYSTSPIPFMQTYGQIAKDGIKVTIDGHGADELFGGYQFDLIYALAGAKNECDFNQILDTYNNMVFSYMKMDYKNAKMNVTHYLEKDNYNELSKLDILNKRLYMTTHYDILPSILRTYDAYGMSNGVEIRMPFMDYRIVQFAFSIPQTSKVRNGYSKAIIRDAVAPYMDSEVMYRKSKIGFNTPITAWMKGDMREFFQDILESQSFRTSTMINQMDVVLKANKVWNNNEANYIDGEKFWNAIVPYLWEKAFVNEEGYVQ